MMLREPPALDDEGVSALLAHEDDGHALQRPIDVEEHSVPAEEPQLALGHRSVFMCRVWTSGSASSRRVASFSTARPGFLPRARRSSTADSLSSTRQPATCQGYIGPEFWSSYPSRRR